VAKLILRTLAKPDSLITFVKDRPGHDRRYAIDSSKIEDELNWRPRVSFEEGLIQTVSWYQQNPGWWQRIITGEYKQYYQKMYGGR
jgi:dTDP-glucose 4,6-dehydratase